jgi:hypothetical protein
MQSAADYRKYAQECIDLSVGKGVSERASLLGIAAEWLKLADQADIQEAFASTPDAIIAPSTDTKQ